MRYLFWESFNKDSTSGRGQRSAAVALNDQGRLGKVFNLMTAHWNLAGNSEHAIMSAKQALNHTRAPEHLDLHIVAHYFLGVAYHNLGQYDAGC